MGGKDLKALQGDIRSLFVAKYPGQPVDQPGKPGTSGSTGQAGPRAPARAMTSRTPARARNSVDCQLDSHKIATTSLTRFALPFCRQTFAINKDHKFTGDK